nr:hypothetical protein CFP56_24915 [Quercus suber]
MHFICVYIFDFSSNFFPSHALFPLRSLPPPSANEPIAENDIYPITFQIIGSTRISNTRSLHGNKKLLLFRSTRNIPAESQSTNNSVGRPTLSKLHRDRVHRARLHVDRDFHSLVTLRRLAKWGLDPNPSDIALAHEITVRRRMAIMRGNKGKEVGVEGSRPETLNTLVFMTSSRACLSS